MHSVNTVGALCETVKLGKVAYIQNECYQKFRIYFTSEVSKTRGGSNTEALGGLNQEQFFVFRY